MPDLSTAPAIVRWGQQNIGEYAIQEYDESLRRAFVERQADFIALDSYPHNQRFLAACVAWAMSEGYLYWDLSVDDSQSEVSSFRLTDAGRIRYFGVSVQTFVEALPPPPNQITLGGCVMDNSVITALEMRIERESAEDAKLAAEELRKLNWVPQSITWELLYLLALNDEETLDAHILDFGVYTEHCCNPDDRSHLNHIIQDAAYDYHIWPSWASGRAIHLLQKHGHNTSWSLGR